MTAVGEPDFLDGSGDEAETSVAIIGMACRFAGAADTEEFWRSLTEGRDLVTRWPPRRLPTPNGSAGRYVPARGLLADPEWFDAGYFGYSPREARVIDPQHRVFLECAVQALEDAGVDPDRCPGAIGIYAGGSDTSYAATLHARRASMPSLTAWEIRLATGADFLNSRVAYKLGLRGPAVTVRAACASSLVAVHIAAQALLAGDCDVALAGGASVRVPAEPTEYSEGGLVSPEGMCRSFDAGASGLVGGEGAGLVVLKRFAEARADGDSIRAVLRGSAINNDGADRIGYTAPGVRGQSEVIRSAQLVAGVHPRTIGYVETHGSATPLGDPIEVAALTEAFRAGGATGRGFCEIGSVKSNIGHTDVAAGVAGLIKTALVVERGVIPPSLHFTAPNPQIDFASTPFRVVTRSREWRPEDLPRRAGVSSFGMGGSNAHVIVEQPPAPVPAPESRRRWQLLVLSAMTPSALRAAAARLAGHLRAHPELPIADVAWTLQTGRRELRYRAYAVVGGHDDAVAALSDPERLVTGDAVASAASDPAGADFAGSSAGTPEALAEAGRRWLEDAEIPWPVIHGGERRSRVPLPTYPFERRRYIVEPDGGEAAANDVPSPPPAANITDIADIGRAVTELFGEFLGLDPGEFDPGDSFFDLGGDSLIGTQLMLRVNTSFPVELELRSLFEAPSAGAFAALVEDRLSSARPGAEG